MEIRKKFVVVLFSIAFVLILTNVVIDNLAKKPVKTAVKEVSVTLLDARLHEALDNYGIKPAWIEQRKFKNSKHDSLEHRYRVILPGDLPHVEVIREFFSLNNEPEIKIIAHEDVVDVKTSLKVLVNDQPKLEATFTTVSDTMRNYPVLSFVLTGFSSLGEEEKNRLLSIPYDLGIGITPSPEGDIIREKAVEFNKPYFVFINDKLEQPYQLEADARKPVLNKSIASITSAYNGATGFIIDNQSELFNSVIFSYLRDSFAAKNSVLYSASRYKVLESNSIEDLLSRIYFYARSSNPGQKKLFLVDARNFYSIREDINKLKKFGYKMKVYPLKDYM